MITNLQNLKPGTAFRVHEMPELTGLLADINECSAKVSLGRHAVEVKIGDREFTAHKSRVEIWSPATVVETIDASAATSPPAITPVDEISDGDLRAFNGGLTLSNHGDEPEETTEMPKTDATRQRRSVKSTKATPAKVTKPPKAKKTAAAKPAKLTAQPDEPAKREHPKTKAKVGVSLLDEAAEVLADGQARSCEAIIEAVLARGKWKTAGKTPAATLYSGLIREIANKEKESRFARGDVKGEFKIAAK